jgi:hypothetical protein
VLTPPSPPTTPSAPPSHSTSPHGLPASPLPTSPPLSPSPPPFPSPPPQPPCASCEEHLDLHNEIAIIKDLVFEVWRDMADLFFRYELQERCEERLEVLISALLDTTPAPGIMDMAMVPTINGEGKKTHLDPGSN